MMNRSNEKGGNGSGVKTLEQLALEVALKERERRLEEVKQAKSQKPEVDPTVLAYQEKVRWGG